MAGSVQFLLKGLVLGFSIAAPVGPIGLLCIRRSLANGAAAGLATGLGAASADACYGAVAGFGLTGVTRFMVGQHGWLSFAGGLFLCALALHTLRARPGLDPGMKAELRVHHAYWSALALTLANPMTILAFAGAFAGLGLAGARDCAAAAMLVAGAFSGSALWWLVLSTSVARLRERFDRRWLQRVNWVSGAILLGFGLNALLSVRG